MSGVGRCVSEPASRLDFTQKPTFAPKPLKCLCHAFAQRFDRRELATNRAAGGSSITQVRDKVAHQLAVDGGDGGLAAAGERRQPAGASCLLQTVNYQLTVGRHVNLSVHYQKRSEFRSAARQRIARCVLSAVE